MIVTWTTFSLCVALSISLWTLSLAINQSQKLLQLFICPRLCLGQALDKYFYYLTLSWQWLVPASTQWKHPLPTQAKPVRYQQKHTQGVTHTKQHIQKMYIYIIYIKDNLTKPSNQMSLQLCISFETILLSRGCNQYSMSLFINVVFV